MEASGQSLKLSGREVEVTVSATVHEPGVVFLRVTLFRQMLALLPEKGFIPIVAAANGITFGDTRLTPLAVDMLLYADPATAPLLHPEERGDMPEQLPDQTQLSLFGGPAEKSMKEHPTTRTGYTNRNGQRNEGCLGVPGTDHNHKLYQMACAKCGTRYNANGSDIHLRRCPSCHGGAPSSGEQSG